jgi:CRISPR-associated Csx2 family protein
MKFISFIGTGPEGDGYTELSYQMEGSEEKVPTKFVQRAEIQLLGKDQFDKIYILCTRESKDFFHHLNDELKDELGVREKRIEAVDIGKIEQTQSAWALFEKISGLINDGDTLVFDLTHGFRSLSIIVSAALNYILKAKNDIDLLHVFYGEKDEDSDRKGTIIDMKDFYTVNQWADGVARLTENADASKLADVAKHESSGTFSNLKDSHLIKALEELTATLRNIDVNRVARNTKNALEIIRSCKDRSTGAELELLCLVEEKFAPLAKELSGQYDADYFMLQLDIIRMLNEHRLYMQAYTVILETIGSIGMLGAPPELIKDICNNAAADLRTSYADLFVRMMNFNNFKSQSDKEKPRTEQLNNTICSWISNQGMLEELKSITQETKKYRNGFDHAWTGYGDKTMKKKIKDEKIDSLASGAVDFLEKLITTLIQQKIIHTRQT